MKFDELVTLLESGISLLPIGAQFKTYLSDGSIGTHTVNRNTDVYVDSNGFAHRDYGPAILKQYSDKTETRWWYKHGKHHRLDGPAIEHINKRSEFDNLYFINGKQYTKEEFEEYIKGLESKEDKELLGDLGQSFE